MLCLCIHTFVLCYYLSIYLYCCDFVMRCVCIHLYSMTYLYGLTRCNGHTYLSLFLSIYINHPRIHVSVGHINMLMKLIKILWFWGVLLIFVRLRRAPYRGSPWAASSLRRPAARGLKGEKNCESLAGVAGGWINFVSVYSYICFMLLFVYIFLSF